MNVLIIEDEMLAAERLTMMLHEYDPSIQVAGVLESIEETVQYLNSKPHPDLLLMDIQLSDGQSFDIFNQVRLHKPVIFTTAYDQYALDAFQHFSIDYILKPVSTEALASAMRKYREMANSFTPPNYAHWAHQVKDSMSNRYKDRFLAKVGSRTFFIQADEVAYFIADNKTVFLVDKEGNRFVINYTIEKLEPLLDPYHFFRINRKIIVYSKMIDLVKPYYNNRLKLSVKNLKTDEEFIVSRERVSAFRKWADG